jgi:DNA-binding PadR family transcriptional regulator
VTLKGWSDRSVLVLASLASGPKHGYALIEDIKSFSGSTLGPGTLYGCLSKLDDQGLIEAMPGDGRRRPYRLTAAGAGELRRHLERSQRVATVGLDRLGTVG